MTAPHGMVERMALAMCASECGECVPEQMEHYRALAREALGELREPTEAMWERGKGEAGIGEAWVAMIDAALAERDPPPHAKRHCPIDLPDLEE